MATYIQGVTDQFPQQVLFEPDYNFLSMVQGTKQAQYDRSLSSVRNMYTSLFNAPITNGQNKEQRDRIFKQIENQLKTLPGLDLSKPQNIQTAQNVFNPIVEDKEIIKDMSETQAAQRELQLAERYRLSDKAEERALYNPTSVQDIQNNLMNLAEAKRGDGSIMNISSRKYTPYVDINKYLSDLIDKEKVSIKSSYKDGQGYIYEVVNGEGQTQAFTEWATARLNNPQIREYFNVMGRVNAENQLRSLSYSVGMTKEDSRNLLAEGIRESMILQKSEEGLLYQKQLRDIDHILGQYKKAYPDGKIPVTEKEKFESILSAKESYTKGLESIEQEILEMGSGDISHIASNIESIYGDQALRQGAANWASTHAKSTLQETIKTDDVLLKQWDLKYNYSKLAQDRELEYMRQDRMDRRAQFEHKSKLEIEQLKYLMGNPGGVLMGYSTTQQSGTAADQFDKVLKQNYTEAYNKAFSYDGSFRNIVGKERYNKIYPTIQKVKAISEGSQNNLNEQDINNLIELGNELGVEVVNPNNSTDAQTMLNSLFSGVYKRTEELISKDPTDKAASNNEQAAKVNGELYAAMSRIIDQTNSLESITSSVADYIAPNGRVKESFQNIPIISMGSNGKPIFDLSKLTPEQKVEISKSLPEEFQKMSMMSGPTYSYNGIKSYELETIMQPNLIQNIRIDGEDITNNFNKGNLDEFTKALTSTRGESLEKLFSENIIAQYDPVTKNVIFDLKIDPTSALSKSLENLTGKTGNVQITIPYETVQLTPALERFSRDVSSATPQVSKLGITESLLSDFDSAIQLPSRYTKAGINATIQGNTDANGNKIVVLDGEFTQNGQVYEIKDRKFSIDSSQDLRTQLAAIDLSIEQLLNDMYSRQATQQRQSTNQIETFNYKW